MSLTKHMRNQSINWKKTIERCQELAQLHDMGMNVMEGIHWRTNDGYTKM
jgi:hypothetical protein